MTLRLLHFLAADSAIAAAAPMISVAFPMALTCSSHFWLLASHFFEDQHSNSSSSLVRAQKVAKYGASEEGALSGYCASFTFRSANSAQHSFCVPCL
jgi:hypothetical protein